MADDDNDSAAPTDEEIAAKRAETFAKLPPAMQRDPKVRRKFGLGDLVELAAKPVASVLGIKKCGECEKRKQWLNAHTPWRRR